MRIRSIMLYREKRTQSEFTAEATIEKTRFIGLGKTKEHAIQALKELLEETTGTAIDLSKLKE
jgi:hypothetical protein